MPITHFHGMTRKAFEAFKAGKGKSELITPWTVSDNDGMMYFYSIDKLRADMGEEDEYLIDAGKNRAFESAAIQASIQEESEIIVLCLDLSNVSTQDDYSCENMHEIADCAHESDVNMSHVVAAYSSPFNKWFAPFILRGIWNCDCFNQSGINPNLAKIIDLLPEDAYIEDMYSPESFNLITE